MRLSTTKPLYCMTHGIISREQYNSAQEALLLAIFDDDDSALRQARESLYPKTIEDAESEIRNRGFRLPWHELTRYAEVLDLSPKRIGRNSMWSSEQIDAVIDHLGEIVDGKIRGRLTAEAYARRRSKTPCDVWLRNERALYPRAKENLAKARETAKCDSIFEVWQAIGADPGEVWPHRWGLHDINSAAGRAVDERLRRKRNIVKLTLKNRVAECDD